jgi:hypothetical protein
LASASAGFGATPTKPQTVVNRRFQSSKYPVANTRIYSILTYAGALPFTAFALLPLLGVSAIQRIGSVDYIAAVYALTIVSFMAGVHWGMALDPQRTEWPVNLFLSSNAVTIMAWLVFLSTTPKITLIIGILAFLYLLWVDYRLYSLNMLTAHYLQTRRRVTALVVLSLLMIVGIA